MEAPAANPVAMEVEAAPAAAQEAPAGDHVFCFAFLPVPRDARPGRGCRRAAMLI